MAPPGLLIGEVAARSGVTRKAVRLYEARGILPRAVRTRAGYRVYPADVLGVLTFVGQARRLGLSLAEIAHVAALRRSGAAPCTHVRRLLELKELGVDQFAVYLQHDAKDETLRAYGEQVIPAIADVVRAKS